MRKQRLMAVSVIAVAVLAFSVGLAQDSKPADGGTMAGHFGAVTDVSFSSGGRWIVSSSLDGTLRTWDATTGKALRTWRPGKEELYSVSATQGDLVASVGHEGEIEISKASSARRESLYSLGRGWALAVRLSPDGRQIAAIGFDPQIQIVDAATGKVQRKWPNKGWVTSLAWSPDGRTLATAWNDIDLWDVATGRHMRTLSGHLGAVRSMSFSPDGRRLASASLDTTARIWDVETGQEKLKIEQVGFIQQMKSGPKDQQLSLPLLAVAFSPDGSSIATAGADRLVRLWDAQTGKNLKTFQGHAMTITALAFSPDGSKIASGSLDRTVRMWPVR